MNVLERLKRKIVSRLTDEVDVYYFDRKNQIDNKVAKLSYKDREVIIDKDSSGYLILFWRRSKEYDWTKEYGNIFSTEESAIKEAKNMIRDDEIWRLDR